MLKYRLAGLISQYTVSAAGSGTAWTVTISSAVSKDWVAGSYTLIGYVEKGTGENLERHEIFSGTITLLPNIPDASAASDLRTHGRRALALIEAAIEKWIGRPIELTIDGKSRVYQKLEELYAVRGRYAAEVKSEENAERVANGLKSSKSLKVSFGPPRW
ncbi:MAG: hypothetical protein AB1428_13055 [Bacteroidota bacterium]